MESYLPVIWAAIIGCTVAMYVILDGFDLGIGILFPFAESERERDQMMNSVAPFWDGNETWLVLGGTGMMVAFPLAYSIILPALYLPVIVMLLALVFRGVALDLRVCGRFGGCGLLPGSDSRRPGPRHQGGEQRVRRRPVRLGDPVRGV